MKTKWLIEDFNADNGTPQLRQACDTLGIEYKTCDYKNSFNNDWPSYYGESERVVCYASIQSCLQIMQLRRWKPTIWYNPMHFSCSYYYPKFKKLLFNDRYLMVPIGDVMRRLDDLFDWLGRHDSIFIRPDSCVKSFSGEVFSREDFEKLWGARISYGAEAHQLAVVSTPKIITAEFRFFVHEQEIITYSQYRGKEATAPTGFVEKVLKQNVYNPFPVWVLDIALDCESYPWVLEVGSFNMSGVYDCDHEKLVKRVSEIAL